MLPEDRKAEGLALTMSISDNITMSDLKPFGPLGFIGPKAQRKAANRWADILSLKRRDVAQPVSDLSGGNQQKCAVARLLHHQVDVLLLDEPTRGIDVGSKAAIYQLIDDLASNRDSPREVLIISSYFPELLGICDRIAGDVARRAGGAQARRTNGLNMPWCWPPPARTRRDLRSFHGFDLSHLDSGCRRTGKGAAVAFQWLPQWLNLAGAVDHGLLAIFLFFYIVIGSSFATFYSIRTDHHCVSRPSHAWRHWGRHSSLSRRGLIFPPGLPWRYPR